MHFARNVVDVNYEIHIVNRETMITKIVNETHSMRYFFEPEILYMLQQCGLQLVQVLDCTSLNIADDKSWTAFFVVRKDKGDGGI